MDSPKSSDERPSIYDSNEYYSDDKSASRLSPVFNSLLLIFDWLRATSVLLQTSLVRGARALDIGAGDGKFLSFLKRAGLSVIGTTASRISQRAAKENFDVELKFELDLDSFLQAEKFDLISYWHVYEHLEKPLAHAALWPRLLKPRGYLIVEVPNIDSIGAKLCYKSWLGSDDKHHINHQHPAEILEIVRSAGFDIKSEQHFSFKFSYVFLWSALVGKLFGPTYDFDELMDILKDPFCRRRKTYLKNLNVLASVFYLFPVTVLLLVVGLVIRRGEVYRIYAQRKLEG